MGGNKKGIDDELTDLLTKLYTMQEDVGAKPKTTDEEKKQKANTVAASMGTGKKTQKKGSKFLELKASVVDNIKSIHGMMSQVKGLESSGFGGDNAKEIIKLQAEIREQIRQAQDEWKQMDQLYKNEARKKRSKFSQEELEVQATLVMRLKQEIDKIKAEQMKGYQTVDTSSSLPGIPTSNISSFDVAGQSAGGAGLSSWGSAPAQGAALTDGQQMALQQIDERDADFDLQLDEIGEGIQDLADIAKMQGEEVKRQGVMLDSLGNKIDKIEEQVSTVNDRMKETLEEVGRASDKLCVDIMCIVLAVGFVAVFYNMARA
mmetsp:Transcript_6876/g.8976  ORF Transcript_6876/g.8976 Transcript_6876/m.8976 type:complete len:318 (+) Transcript_6876:89-1042(+)|eukprot:CAMPEP_0195269090 /NCGR_PEP_ID=MMETSP0706-20130129/13555_1 /TAXON_ID=33640 /ORGANISM="Asterionellopsis glacialis, Strain CCMP134" /LENGTH=317 /DNA_ID=CAMNT_0040324119 /DNA_START=82 /DNA_END=1035 /DNA_ORIENTATION=+